MQPSNSRKFPLERGVFNRPSLHSLFKQAVRRFNEKREREGLSISLRPLSHVGTRVGVKPVPSDIVGDPIVGSGRAVFKE